MKKIAVYPGSFDPVTFDWADGSTEHVIETAVFARALNCLNVFALFNNANHGLVASSVAAYIAAIFFADVSADIAETNAFFNFTQNV